MSWGFYGIGTPNALKQALARSLDKQTGQSQEEMAAAVPHINALLDLQKGKNQLQKLSCDGRAYGLGTESEYSNTNVELQDFGAMVVEEPEAVAQTDPA